MIGREKVVEAERQVRNVINGATDAIHCPFCQRMTEKGAMLCCMLMAEVATAILDHVEFKQTAQKLEEIMDRASRN